MPRTEIPNDKLLIHLTVKEFRQVIREENDRLIEAVSNVQPQLVKSSVFRKIVNMGESFFESRVALGLIKRYQDGGLDLYDVQAYRKHLEDHCEVPAPKKMKLTA